MSLFCTEKVYVLKLLIIFILIKFLVLIQYTPLKWKVSKHYNSEPVLSNLGHSYDLTEATNVVISKNERGFF